MFNSDFGDLFGGNGTSKMKEYITKLFYRVDALEKSNAQLRRELDTLREKTNNNVTKIVNKIKKMETL